MHFTESMDLNRFTWLSHVHFSLQSFLRVIDGICPPRIGLLWLLREERLLAVHVLALLAWWQTGLIPSPCWVCCGFLVPFRSPSGPVASLRNVLFLDLFFVSYTMASRPSPRFAAASRTEPCSVFLAYSIGEHNPTC